MAQTQTNVVSLTLEQCLAAALLNNRDLQAERINVDLARGTLDASYGYYDPIFLGSGRRSSDADGGFDPVNPSADAVYEADSTIASLGLTGVLPSGLTYSLATSYAHSDGTRNSLDFDAYKLSAGLIVQQPLLRNFWIDAGRHAIKVNRHNVRFTEHAVRFVALTVVTRVREAYYEFAWAAEALRIQQRLVNTRRDMLRGVQRQIEQGLATLPDEQLALAQLAQAETGLHSLNNALAHAENLLRTEMGDTFTNQVLVTWRPADHLLLLPVTPSLSESWSRGLERRPDLAQFRVAVERADTDLRFHHNQLFPSLDLIASYSRRGASTSEDVPPFTPQASFNDSFRQLGRGDAVQEMVGVVFTMPLTRKAERANHRNARQLKAQAEIRLKQQEELVLRQISDAIQAASHNYERARAARQSAQFARGALEAEDKRLAGGASSIFFVLQLQNDLVTSELAEARARADYNRALAQWHFAEGTALEQHQIELKFAD